MAAIDDFINKQKDGARFVITAQMLRLPVQQFDTLALGWIADGGPGFAVSGVPHRVVVDGRFFISRVTVVKDGAPA
ncbi:hypothetical protein [Janthinobacterium fluminis]|uniref:Uncharacterized protein n=1 Tax=Janthinobacterium fluminis TaxID=2987524 RepID=A0ABT5JZ66_9BURK|nr:hypothetical protein [Janthinobacterium fluminis]MDC8757453.1 hypothetical protein [Janthinobacterium fluminis]